MYSAKTVSEKLMSEGYNDMTTRKIYFYVFEKKMFPVSGTGKEIFSDEDIEKLKTIAFLKENTKHTLDEIKEMIKNMPTSEIINSTVCEKINTYSAISPNSIQTNQFMRTAKNNSLTSETFTNASSNNIIISPSSTSESTTVSNSCNTSTSCSYTNNSLTGTPPDGLQSPSLTNPYPSYPLPNYPGYGYGYGYGYSKDFTNYESKETDAFKEEKSGSKTQIKLAKGIVLEYDKSADSKLLNKIIQIFKIMLEEK